MLPKQIKFCKEYIKDLNATQAAIRAGYSVKTAYSIGSENLKKPEIKTYIAELIKEAAIGADETIKLISDISKSSLNDYFIVRMVPHTPMIKKTLKKIVKEMDDQYLFEEEFAARATLTDEQMEAHIRSQEDLDLKMFRYKMELEKNPKATRIVPGPTELIESVELDLVKLAKDKESGRIKSYQMTASGPKIELYAADAALKEMAKLHNLYTTKVEITGKDGEPLFEGFDAFMAECKNIKLEDDE